MGGSDGEIKNWWILYEGQQVIFYEGDLGNNETSRKIATFKASSGLIATYSDGSIADWRNSKYQFTTATVNEGGKIITIHVGPVPEGNYSINLSKDPKESGK